MIAIKRFKKISGTKTENEKNIAIDAFLLPHPRVMKSLLSKS
jgi:hypothetical protein